MKLKVFFLIKTFEKKVIREGKINTFWWRKLKIQRFWIKMNTNINSVTTLNVKTLIVKIISIDLII